MNKDADKKISIAITGASGVVYGVRLIKHLLEKGFGVRLVISSAGEKVLKEELGLNWSGEDGKVEEAIRDYYSPYGKAVDYYRADDLLAPLASGSSLSRAMIVCPCSMGTMARIAQGVSGNLIERAADVIIKEGGRLVIVPRETPLSPIHLENMCKLSNLGVTILPAMPAFYHKPQGIDDLVDFVIGKIFDRLGIDNSLFKRWG